ncbi:MAG: M20/M25/M40 family metallo-hydrolase [Flavitalea sp.]
MSVKSILFTLLLVPFSILAQQNTAQQNNPQKRVPQGNSSKKNSTQKNSQQKSSPIIKLKKDKKVQSALEKISLYKDNTLRDHILLNEIPAPPFKEMNRAKKLMEMLLSSGADTAWIDEVGNLVAVRKGTDGKKVVVIEGHMDTVFPESTDVKVKNHGDTLYAPGIADDTRSLAVLNTLMKVVKEENIRTRDDIWFVGTVGEEGLGDLRGVKHLFSQHSEKIRSVISIEPVDGIVTKGLGSIRYRVFFKGPGGHSNGNFGIVNPIHALGKAIQEFSTRAEKYTSEAGNDATFNVGVIGGGTSVNSIAFEASMEVDMRSGRNDRLKTLDSMFRVSMKEAVSKENAAKKSGADITLELVPIGNRPTGEADMQSSLLLNTIAVFKDAGVEPKFKTVSTNANIPFSMNIPAVCIGVGGKAGNLHSLNEWWLDDGAEEAVKRSLLILLLEAGY